MMQCTTQLDLAVNHVSDRALATPRAWHPGTAVAISTVGTAFKPYGQRPKERLP